MLAPLLRADLKHAAGFLHGVADAEAFVDRQRERLLAVHVAAGPQRGDGDRHVPVVGRADRDDVRLLLLEQLAVVAVQLQLVVELGVELGRVDVVDVADGDHAGVLRGPHGDRGALGIGAAAAADADRRHRVRRRSRSGRWTVGPEALAPDERNGSGSTGRRRMLEKFPPS